MYRDGFGVPKDDVQAYMWLNLAAARGAEGADTARDALALDMSRERIEQAQELSRNWKPQPQKK
jgi:TPR repeat protein